MILLSWEEPPQQRSPTAHADTFQSDTGIPGTFVPNMSVEDQQRWKAKLIGGKDPRVEVRKRFGVALGVIVVRYDRVTLSFNGKAEMTATTWTELQQAINEAQQELCLAVTRT